VPRSLAKADATAYLTVSLQSHSRPPALYFYKLFLVLAVLGGLVCTFASPFVAEPLRHHLLMILAIAVGCNAVCGVGQAIRMLGATLRLRRSLVNAAGGRRGAKVLLDREPARSCRDQGLHTRLIVQPAALNHVFIIPNYKEDLETLSATLGQLASHPAASSYTVVLAMEANEAGAVNKARKMQESFQSCFRSVVHTVHTMQQGEMPGKASNVNAAVRQFYPLAKGDKDSYMLTVIDADALVPHLYIQELDAKAAQVSSTYAVYAGPVMFEQNTADVPAMVRVTDYMWAAFAHQNLNSFCGVGFPISNYSLPLSLAHEMGWAAAWPPHGRCWAAPGMPAAARQPLLPFCRCCPVARCCWAAAGPPAAKQLLAAKQQEAVASARASCCRAAPQLAARAAGSEMHCAPARVAPQPLAKPPTPNPVFLQLLGHLARCHRRGHAPVPQGLLQDQRRHAAAHPGRAHQHVPRLRRWPAGLAARALRAGGRRVGGARQRGSWRWRAGGGRPC
jgi:hypothetical protein